MKDFYKHIEADEESTESTIQAAIASKSLTLEPEVLDAAKFVLLDEQRRAVYDRNRQVLLTIGALRSHLGMNLRPFWARADARDFTYVSAPRRRDQPTDPIAVIRAASGGRRKRVRRRWLKRLAILVVILLVVMAILRWS